MAINLRQMTINMKRNSKILFIADTLQRPAAISFNVRLWKGALSWRYQIKTTTLNTKYALKPTLIMWRQISKYVLLHH